MLRIFKNKLYLVIFLMVILFLIFMKFVGYYSKEDKGIFGFFGRMLNTTNEFHVTYNNVNREDFDIIWTTESMEITLVKNGELIDNFSYDYGPEKFNVFYKKDLICTGVFWSFNNNDPHCVFINIEKALDQIVVIFSIDDEPTQTFRYSPN